MGFFTD